MIHHDTLRAFGPLLAMRSRLDQRQLLSPLTPYSQATEAARDVHGDVGEHGDGHGVIAGVTEMRSARINNSPLERLNPIYNKR